MLKNNLLSKATSKIPFIKLLESVGNDYFHILVIYKGKSEVITVKPVKK